MIGFIGLGNMGYGIARNLMKSGFSLTIVGHVRKEPVDRLASEGACVVDSPKKVAEASEFVITCLPSEKVCEEVILGKDGVLEGAADGTVIIQTSTVHPSFMRKLNRIAKTKDVDVLEALLMGGREGAIAGNLHLIVGGESEILNKCMPLFKAFSKKISHVGGVGSASTFKIINNLCVLVHEAVGFEAISLAVAAGVDLQMLYNVVKEGTGNSWTWEHLFSRMISGKTIGIVTNEFRDVLSTIIGFADELATPVLTAKAALELFQEQYPEFSNEDLLEIMKHIIQR